MERSGNSLRQGGALFLHASANQKLSRIKKVPYTGPAKDKFPYRPTPVAPFCCSTYTSISATCPDSCAFKRGPNGEAGGCYADAGKTVHTIARLDREAAPFSGDDVVVSEADLIDRAFPAGMPQDGARGGRDLRLHVGGDTTSRDATVFLGQAATRWRKRGGGKVWTYTHRWHEVLRSNWGPDISVLASVENPREADTALDHGYAPAIVVPRHASAKTWVGEYGIKFIPCPAETGDRVCVECRLCFDDTALKKRETGIAFAIHGSHKPRALTRLGYGQRKLL
jgi:hypothetical protein